AARPLHCADMSAAVGTGHDMSAPSARRVLVGAPRRARGRPPGTCCDAPWGAGTGLGRALAQNLLKVGPASALGATASAQGGIAASDCIGLPQPMVRTDGSQVAMVQADQTVWYQKVKVERAYGTEREICSAGLPHASSLHSEPVASPLARLGEAPAFCSRFL